MIRKIRSGIQYEYREAIRDLSLDISSGENVGLIGRNGAGKSTLLKLICRVHRPSAGRVVVAGRVAPLLELGLGISGELTGRENVLLQGAVLGFSGADMRRRLPRIVQFAELEDFIDLPTRTYSTGMVARLAFSVATDVDPDILLVDEALAVGDQRFQEKCRERMTAFREAGKTVIIVSHSLVQIRTSCQRVVWIDRGNLIADGETNEVCDAYTEWSKLDPGHADALAFAAAAGLRPALPVRETVVV